jgi:hypothetical protein
MSSFIKAAARINCYFSRTDSLQYSMSLAMLLRRRGPCLIAAVLFALLGTFGVDLPSIWAGERLYALNVYVGRLTSNRWGDFFIPGERFAFKDSYLLTAALARRIGTYGNKASFEIEGQVVKHFKGQEHWEFNALLAARWEAFWWDEHLDTSLAFGLGPSIATEKPVVESEGQYLVYWMIELALGLPEYPQTAFITRIHHRSNAFGLVGDEGGSNSLALGLKYRF